MHDVGQSLGHSNIHPGVANSASGLATGATLIPTNQYPYLDTLTSIHILGLNGAEFIKAAGGVYVCLLILEKVGLFRLIKWLFRR